ncbi:GntR family transcriptional regulator [Microlunatus soli]|uniref:DNA-binding transcriptional regulator, GntR family n=1 Tax=Microlunatus soli TaxID=630515 RepID=A0A1H1ZC61_9ACTN|nr:GntR family transcriptional regulator [Microlunatus soli]SDT30786.1 DNA-binding transcriptional regulator, GntR family [Microlunatus soli]
MISPVDTSAASKAELAHRWITERIADRTYRPGHRLVLAPIAAELGISVVPVREAIRLLEAEGLVTFTRNIGAQVAVIDPDRYTDAMETLGILEAAATALAAPLLDREDVERARRINAEMINSLPDPSHPDDFVPHDFTELNLRFHTVLFEQCPNAQVLADVHRSWQRLNTIRDSTFAVVPDRARESVAEHERLLIMIENRSDPWQIERSAREHRLATLHAYRDHNARARSAEPTDGGTR